jgi:hypothetical protein
MLLGEPTFPELARALAGRDGRMILGGGRPMEDLALHVLDIAQNSIEAGAASIGIEVAEEPARDLLVIEVRDDGPGMDAGTAARAADPFYTTRTTRRVGLGLALLGEAARASGGGLQIDSRPGAGTRVRATFGLRHIDRAPLGDLETTLMVLLASHPEIAFEFRRRRGDEVWELGSEDLRRAGIDPASPEGLAATRAAIRRVL